MNLSEKIAKPQIAEDFANTALAASAPMGEADGPRVIFVVDWWEKLAGASLALTGMVQLCKASGMALVEPFVHSSMFRPFPQPESLPLDAYYELEPIRAAVRLVTYARWEAHAAAADATGPSGASRSVASSTAAPGTTATADAATPPPPPLDASELAPPPPPLDASESAPPPDETEADEAEADEAEADAAAADAAVAYGQHAAVNVGRRQ